MRPSRVNARLRTETRPCYARCAVNVRIPVPDTAPAQEQRGAPVQLVLDGNPVRAYRGESVAVGLYASGHRVLSRSIKYHRPRAFFCLEGHCGGCLMRIAGVPNQRACMEPCADGLVVQPQNAYPSADLDVLEAVDWLFPGGMNHHTLMTGSSLLNAMANKVVRKLSGLGEIPDAPPASLPATEHLRPDVLVIGGGAAGLAAATAAAAAGARTVLCDEHHALGGSLLADPRHGPADAARRVQDAIAAGVDLRPGAVVLGYYPEDPAPVLVAASADRALLLEPRCTVWATGGYAVNVPFVNNDRPGVLAARAVGRLLVQHRVKPAHRVCLVDREFGRESGREPWRDSGQASGDAAGGDTHGRALARALEQAGCEVVIVGPEQRVLGARGRAWVTAIEVEGPRGRAQRIDCDLVAVAATPAPASEGPRQHGCQVALRPEAGGFAVQADQDGRTGVPGVFACGDVCGFMGPDAATRMGARAGRAAAAEARS
jgi:sarcosine oxidase subunit alpha